MSDGSGVEGALRRCRSLVTEIKRSSLTVFCIILVQIRVLNFSTFRELDTRCIDSSVRSDGRTLKMFGIPSL